MFIFKNDDGAKQEAQDEDPAAVQVSHDESQGWHVRSEVLPHKPAGHVTKQEHAFK